MGGNLKYLTMDNSGGGEGKLKMFCEILIWYEEAMTLSEGDAALFSKIEFFGTSHPLF